MLPHDLWQLFNLRDTPFFQEALRPGEGARYPVEWFVGRDAEADRLTRTILGHAGSSRQSIRGSAGVGKSTLAQRVKALLAPQRLYSAPDAVALGHADGADEVCIRILSYIYETLLAAAQSKGQLSALADARARLTATQVNALEKLVQRVQGEHFLIKDAVSIWKNERSRAARLVAELRRAGYVLPLERIAGEERGRPATAHALSGSALLAFS